MELAWNLLSRVLGKAARRMSCWKHFTINLPKGSAGGIYWSLGPPDTVHCRRWALESPCLPQTTQQLSRTEGRLFLLQCLFTALYWQEMNVMPAGKGKEGKDSTLFSQSIQWRVNLEVRSSKLITGRRWPRLPLFDIKIRFKTVIMQTIWESHQSKKLTNGRD